MPVSLSEWRVRIGKFVHWISEYEVQERRERLLKERIRRLKVLCERLKAKRGDSGEESEYDKSRQDGPDPKGCSHTIANIRSSGYSSDIKDLLTSCDQCIQELLTASDNHIKEILTPSETCIKQLLTPTDSNIRHLLSLTNCCRKDQHTQCDSHVEDLTMLTPNYSNIRELIIHSDSCFRGKHMSADACKDDTLSDSDVKDLLTRGDSYTNESLTPRRPCIKELLTPRDSYIKELLTPRDSCIKELLTPRDSCIRELLTPIDSCIKELLTPRDSCIKELLTPRDSCIKELLTPIDSCIRELLTPIDSCTKELLTPRYSCIRELLTPIDSCIKELLTPRDSCIKELLTPRDSCIKELLTPRDSCIRELPTPRDSCIKELLTPRDSCIKELLTPRDSCIKELLTPRDSCIRELLTPIDSCTKELLTPRDSCIRELLTPRDSCIKELLTPRDSCIRELLTPIDSCIKDLLTPRDSCIRELLTPRDFCIWELLSVNSHTDESLSPGDGYIQQIFTPRNSYISESLTTGDSYIQELLTQRDSYTSGILSPKDFYILQIFTPGDSDTDESLKPIDSNTNVSFSRTSPESYANESLTRGDSYNHDFLSRRDSYIRELLTPRDSFTIEPITQGDSYIRELLTPRVSYTNESLTTGHSHTKKSPTPGDSYIQEVFTPRDSHINKLLTPSESYANKSLTQGDFYNHDFLSPRDSYIRELLKPRDSFTIEPITQGDSYIRELLTPRDSHTNDSLTPGHSHTKKSSTPGDSYIQGVFTPRDSYTNELLTPTNYYANELLTPGDSYIHKLLTPGDSYTNDSFPPGNSFAYTSLAQGDSYIQELFTQRDSHTQKLLTHTGSYDNDLLTPGYSYIQELLIPRDSHTNESLAPGHSYTNESLTPGHSFTNTSRTQGDSYIHELLAPRDSHTNKLLTPTESFANDPLTPEDFYIQELLLPIDSYANEPLTPGHSYTNKSLTGVELESPRQGDKTKSPTSSLDSDALQHGPSGGKEMANTSSRSSCHKMDSLKGTVDVMLSQQPYLTKILLVKAGDVELNPGPLHGSMESVLQEIELIRLAEVVPGNCYNKLCDGLGFSISQSQNVLTQHLLNIPGALIELFNGWKVKQRDGTNCRALLGEILKNADMDDLRTKLLEGEYLTPGTSPSDPIMTEAQVLKCGEDLKTFYREQLCKIKPDPLDFKITLGFEQIYTNLTLLRNEMVTKKTKTPLDYTDLLATKINGVLPKRLLVEGEGGVGKTTFCSKIAWDWLDGSPEFQRFSWVLVIPLRDVVKGQTIGDIMKNYLSDSNAANPKQIDNYILSQPTKVLIVLDGLDEYDGDLSAEESSDISQILRLEKFKECTVLVTTRTWRADQIKSNKELSKVYAFIAVDGFSAENVLTYISKYFVNDKNAGSELCRFIEVNDVIKENMAPFPIYVAMLCILWENCDSEKRDTISRLKTFSQLFEQMILFLSDHYLSKDAKVLHEASLDKEMENMKLCRQRIGSIAFSGLLKKKLVFKEEDFRSCKEAMMTCCRIGLLSRENQNVCRWKRTLNASQSVTTNVFFPHKLFQEYIASVYLASLYDTNRLEYSSLMGEVLSKNPQEFRYLLYFTAAMGKEVGLDIVKRIQQNDFLNVQQRNNEFLIDVTFEAFDIDTAKAVGLQIFADEKMLTIDKDMPAHTVSGYLFIMEQHGMETLVFRGRSWGPTVSRDLADVLFASNSLSRLVFYITTLDDDFYQSMHTRVSTIEGEKSSIQELVIDDEFLNGLQRFNNGDINVTVGDLFPRLTQLTFTTGHTVSPKVVERLAHSNLTVLSIEHGKRGRYQVPLIGEPASLGQLFSSSFPRLACLTFRELVMGNIRSEAILHNLKNHLHLRSISIISCFTDDELDPLAKQITTQNRMEITFQHDTAQRALSLGGKEGPLTIDMIDALCHRTCVHHLEMFENGVKIEGEECFPGFHGREVDSKIQTFKVRYLQLRKDQSASCCLGKFLSHLSRLTDLNIDSCSLHDNFYKEIADRASSSQIQKFMVDHMDLLDQSASYCLGKFLSLLSHLTDLKIKSCSLHEDFFKEIADQASSSKIQKLTVGFLDLHKNQSESCCLGKFLGLLPNLTDLDIDRSIFHDDFYKEIADRASSSQIQTANLNFKEYNGKHIELLGHLASTQLAKFLCSLPFLTTLTMIGNLYLHDVFFTEFDSLAAFSQIQTVNLYFKEDYDKHVELLGHLASKQLAKLLCYLPCLTTLMMKGNLYLHDSFITELGSLAAFSQIQTVKLDFMWDRYVPVMTKLVGHSASKQLAKFLCSSPFLTTLTMEGNLYLSDDLITELGSLAAFSQIRTVNLDFRTNFDKAVKELSHSASNQLANFICSLPCLTTLEIKGSEYLPDAFFTELASLAASPQNPYFKEKKQISLLQAWSARKDLQQKQ